MTHFPSRRIIQLVKVFRSGIYLVPILLAGCGGSGGGSDVVVPTPTPAVEKGTALFDVDVASGKVRVQPLETAGSGTTKGKSAVLTGTAVSFETTTLLSEGGEVGRRAIKVRLKNNLTEAIGVGRPIRIQFGVVGPVTAYPTDLRDQATVSSPVQTATVGFLDGAVSNAQISTPTAVAVGQDGAIYFNGTDNRIRRLQDGFVSTVAQNVPAAGLTYLRDSVTAREFLVAGCPTLHSIKLIPIASGSVSTWAGLDNTSGNINGAATTARFNGPRGVTVDASNNQVLVADTDNGAVRAIPFTFSGGNLVAGTVLTRYSGLTTPYHVAVSSNRTVGIVERNARRVRLFNAGSSREAIVGTGLAGDVLGDGNVARFSSPEGITTLGDTFFVADTGNYKLKRIALKNGAAPLLGANWTVADIAGAGIAGFVDGAGNTARFDQLNQLTADSQGRILGADSGVNGIRRIVSQGSFDFGTPDGTAVGTAKLTNPTGFADLNGLQRPYIEVNQRVEPGQTVDAGEWQFSIPSTVNAFRFAVTVETGTSVYAGLEAVLNPSGGAGSPNVVAQYLSRNSYSGGVTGRVEDVAFDSTTTYMASDAAGNMYLSEGVMRVIRRLDKSGNVTLIAGKAGALGSTDGNGTDARFGYPNAIQVNGAGTEILVADESNNTIRRVALYYDGADPSLSANWNVSTIAGAAGFPGDNNGTGDVARFRGPVGITGPSNDEVFTTEYTGVRVKQIRYIGGNRALATSWSVDTVAGTNEYGYVDGSGFTARFGNLVGAVYSAEASKLFICDRGNNRIRAMDLLTRNVTTVAGDGANGLNDNSNALLARFQYLNAITTDSTGALYIGDHSRVRRLFDGSVKTVAGGGDGSGTSGDKVMFSLIYGMGMNAQGDLLLNSNGRLVRLTRKLGR